MNLTGWITGTAWDHSISYPFPFLSTPTPTPHPHPHYQADAALATGPEASHVPKSSSTNVTIQARLSSPKASKAAATQREEGGQEDVEMSRHGEQQAPAHEGDEMNDADIEEEETEEDRKYDGVDLEETDCPLCHFMRASACGATWVRWEKCIHYHKEKEEDFVGPCSRVTLRLAQCIEKHKETFPPMLRNALLGGGKGEDDEIAEDGEIERHAEKQAQAEAEGADAAAAAVAAPAPETSAALAATAEAAAAAGKEQEPGGSAVAAKQA